jgi:hypothetical protein
MIKSFMRAVRAAQKQLQVLMLVTFIGAALVAPAASVAQNLGTAPATGQAVQGQTASQPEGAFLNLVNWVTTAGCRPIGGTSGLASIFQASGRKVRVKSLSRSIARGRSMRASWASSRRKFAPFSKVKGRAVSMCSTSIPRSIRPRSIKQGSRSCLLRLAEEGRTSRPASGGWTSAELCRRPWFSLPTYAAHSQGKVLPTQCCGPPPRLAGRHLGK